jgi:hypothetical protein
MSLPTNNTGTLPRRPTPHCVTAGSATQLSAPGPTGTARYDGGPEEGGRGVAPAQPPYTRYDGRGAVRAGLPGAD